MVKEVITLSRETAVFCFVFTKWAQRVCLLNKYIYAYGLVLLQVLVREASFAVDSGTIDLKMF